MIRVQRDVLSITVLSPSNGAYFQWEEIKSHSASGLHREMGETNAI